MMQLIKMKVEIERQIRGWDYFRAKNTSIHNYYRSGTVPKINSLVT
jgi:hypothetical protein